MFTYPTTPGLSPPGCLSSRTDVLSSTKPWHGLNTHRIYEILLVDVFRRRAALRWKFHPVVFCVASMAITTTARRSPRPLDMESRSYPDIEVWRVRGRLRLHASQGHGTLDQFRFGSSRHAGVAGAMWLLRYKQHSPESQG